MSLSQPKTERVEEAIMLTRVGVKAATGGVERVLVVGGGGRAREAVTFWTLCSLE